MQGQEKKWYPPQLYEATVQDVCVLQQWELPQLHDEIDEDECVCPNSGNCSNVVHSGGITPTCAL